MPYALCAMPSPPTPPIPIPLLSSSVRAWCVLILSLSFRIRTHQQKPFFAYLAPLRFNNPCNPCQKVKSEGNYVPHYLAKSIFFSLSDLNSTRLVSPFSIISVSFSSENIKTLPQSIGVQCCPCLNLSLLRSNDSFREAMTIFVRRSLPDKCLCPSVPAP